MKSGTLKIPKSLGVKLDEVAKELPSDGSYLFTASLD